ncbi:MAG: hypothetical protein AB9861_19410 [Methanosarcina sp.]|jgi:hypothetical protein
MDEEVEVEKRDKNSDRGRSKAAGKSKYSRKSKYEKLYVILVGIFLAAIFFYTLYIGELFWGIFIDILILRLYFLMEQERRYFRECNLNEEEAGTAHDPRMRRRVMLANILITLFVLGLVVYAYFTLQFIWGIVVGLMVLLYIHMLLFSEKNL